MRFQKMGGASMASVPAATKPTVPPVNPDAMLMDPLEQIGSDVVDFRGYFKVETYPHNGVIYRPGDSGGKVYLLKRGRVRLIRTGRNAARSVLAILKAGD